MGRGFMPTVCVLCRDVSRQIGASKKLWGLSCRGIMACFVCGCSLLMLLGYVPSGFTMMDEPFDRVEEARKVRQIFASQMRHKTIVVFQGGGVRGAYSAGVLKKLLEKSRDNLLALRYYEGNDHGGLYDDVDTLYRFHCTGEWEDGVPAQGQESLAPLNESYTLGDVPANARVYPGRARGPNG